MLHILMGRAGTGKTARILDRIRELGDAGTQTLLVPEHASHQAEVDLCRVCGDTASRHAEVLSLRRLGDRVLSITGGAADTALDPGGKLLTLQRCVAELAPVLKVYRRPSRKAAFLSQLLNVFDELRSYGVTPEALSEKAGDVPGATRDKLADLSLLYGAYETRLRAGDRDARDRMSRLCDSLEPSGWARGRDLFLDGFSYFNAQERRILGVFLRQARSVTVTLLGEPDSAEEIFEPALKTLGQLTRLADETKTPYEITTLRAPCQGVLGHLERYFFSDARPLPDAFHCKGETPVSSGTPLDTAELSGGGTPVNSAELSGGAEAQSADADRLTAPIRLREARSVLAEAEQTAADIRRLAAGGFARYRDITVTARNMEDYEGAVEAAFARWGIPAYLSRRTDLLEKPAVCLVTGVLSAVTGGYEYEDMFRWLKTGLAGLSPDECDLLENYVLKWEIHGAMWLRDVPWTDHPDGYGVPMKPEHQRRLDIVNALRGRVRGPLSALAEGLKAGKTAKAKVDALYSFLERLAFREALEARMAEQAAAGRLQEAEETAQLWETLCGVLDQFVEILGEKPLDTDTFAQLMRQILTQYSVGTIPVSLDQVSVTALTRNDRRPSKYVFLLGANDHVLPGAGQSGGILNEDDRRALRERGVELSPTGTEQLSVEMQNLYAALSKAQCGLVVSYPTADAAGAELRPAFVVERLRAMFPGLTLEQEDPARAYRLTAPIPALEAAGTDPAGPLRAFFQSAETDAAFPLPGVAEKLAAMDGAAALRRGALSPQAVRMLYGARPGLSASRLERLRTCHFAYFVQYGLRAKPRDAASFDAPEIGTFLHYLLEHVTRDVLSLGGFANVDDDELERLAEAYIRQFAEEELGGLSGRTARFRYLFRRLKSTALAVVLRTAEELRHSDFRPAAFELSFGGGSGDVPAVVISTPDTDLTVGGRADRVDGWIQGDRLFLRVVDYKSGKKKFELKNVRMGLDIQMLLYLFALGENGGAFFGKDPAFQGKELVPAGVLYQSARDDILPADRNISPAALLALREKTYRESGLVLSSPDVLQAMEHEALTEPHYLPIRVKKDGSLSGALASAEQLGRLGLYVDWLIREIGAELARGCIDADPCSNGGDDSPGRYSGWAGAGHLQDGRDSDHTRLIRPIKPEEFWELVDRETEGMENHGFGGRGGGTAWRRH